jgi:hypothetical protein
MAKSGPTGREQQVQQVQQQQRSPQRQQQPAPRAPQLPTQQQPSSPAAREEPAAHTLWPGDAAAQHDELADRARQQRKQREVALAAQVRQEGGPLAPDLPRSTAAPQMPLGQAGDWRRVLEQHVTEELGEVEVAIGPDAVEAAIVDTVAALTAELPVPEEHTNMPPEVRERLRLELVGRGWNPDPEEYGGA